MKNVVRYVFVFLFALGILIFFSSINTYDAIWNYGFSYALSKFQTPFVEINMITPGFYPMIMSLGMFLCHNNLVFLIEQALFFTFAFYLLYQLFQKKAWMFLFFMCFPSFLVFTPTYNFFLLVLVILLVYLEQRKKSDLWIGVVLGIAVLTKQTVGVFLLLPSIVICFKDLKRLGKRVLGFCIPCFIYLFFLLITHSFSAFFDLCVLGLFDFASNNTEVVTGYFVLAILLFIISILYVIKNPKDILGYYVLAFFSVMIPIFSYYHFYVYLVAVSLLLMNKLPISTNYIRNLSLLLCFMVVVFNIFLQFGGEKHSFLGIHNFNFLYTTEDSRDSFLVLDQLYSKYQKKGNVEILSSENPWIKIKREEKLNYFAVYLSGNFGYHGSKKMIQKVKDLGDCYYILDQAEYRRAKKNNEQFEIDTTRYIQKYSRVVEKKNQYVVYEYRGE